MARVSPTTTTSRHLGVAESQTGGWGLEILSPVRRGVVALVHTTKYVVSANCRIQPAIAYSPNIEME